MGFDPLTYKAVSTPAACVAADFIFSTTIGLLPLFVPLIYIVAPGEVCPHL
jgi:hypothetical protein